MITIKNIRIKKSENRAKLVGDIQLSHDTVSKWEKKMALIDKRMEGRYHRTYLNDNRFEMWFDVPVEYEYALCYERSDAFVVACLYFAMVAGEDIICEVPITEKLLYQIREYIVRSLCKDKDGNSLIKIIADSAEECPKSENYIGTGISCGVDSFSTILLHMKNDISRNYRLTHLTLFNTGSMNFSGYDKNKSLEEWREETYAEFQERKDLGKRVAQDFGLKFMDIDTNIADLYQGAFLYSHITRNCSAILATQKMWKNYYYSSAGLGVKNEVSLEVDQSYYETLLLPCISLSDLQFYSGGLPYGRLKKIQLIMDEPVVKKYINVCTCGIYNCGECDKCTRTLTALDLLGKINDFRKNFVALDHYSKYRWKYMGNVLDAKYTPNTFYNEMYNYAKLNNIKFDWKSKVFHYLLPVRKIRRWIFKL